jgi:hypothetical protein
VRVLDSFKRAVPMNGVRKTSDTGHEMTGVQKIRKHRAELRVIVLNLG